MMPQNVPDVLKRTFEEIAEILRTIRTGREELANSAAERLEKTRDKLREVSSATEMAATDMMDGLERALTLLDTMDDTDTRAQVRDELCRVMMGMQFQDITSQQLAAAGAMLGDVESRLNAIVERVDSALFGVEPVSAPLQVVNGELDYNPGATIHNSRDRQAVADAIFSITP